MAGIKDAETHNLETGALDSGPFQAAVDSGAQSFPTHVHGREIAGELGGEDHGKCAGFVIASVEGRGRGGLDCKAWQQEGDWPCPNLSCSNINFSFRGICNRCGTARPAGTVLAIGGGTGCGRSRGRGSGDLGCRSGRGPGGPPGLFGPNDWNCPMCGNVNWAKRTKCNICNTTKPGYNEGGAREGRAGGYKELDEAEIEETKRRRREIEEDDGEMYDEFGYLKKKFRAKGKAGDSHVAVDLASGGMGKAGWDMEESGLSEQSKEKNKERSGSRYDYDSDSNRGGRNKYFHNLSSAPSGQPGRGSGRDSRHAVDEWDTREGHRNLLQDRSIPSIKNHDRDPSEAWPWRNFAVKGRGETECVIYSENDQHGEWLHGRKRLRERDRIQD